MDKQKIKFSKQENKILDLIAEGFSDKEIGEKVGLSHHTVTFYVSRLLLRLGAFNRTHLIALCFRNGVLK